MADASMNRIGGNALIGGGVLFAMAALTHPDISTSALAASANVALWTVGHWAYLIGDVLIVAGLLMLVRQVAASGSASTEAWATIALAAGVVAFTLDAVSSAIHLMSFLPAVTAGTPGVYEALIAVGGGIGAGGFYVASLGLVLLAIALRKAGWSPAVANTAMAVGALQLVLLVMQGTLGRPLIPAGTAQLVVNALMPAAYAVVGVAFARSGTAPAPTGAR
jgi:hypothetical protein